MLWPATNHTEFKLYAFSFNTHHAAAAAPRVDHRVAAAAAAAAMLWLYSRTLWLVLKGVNDSNQVDSLQTRRPFGRSIVIMPHTLIENHWCWWILLVLKLCYSTYIWDFFFFFSGDDTPWQYFLKINGVLIYIKNRQNIFRFYGCMIILFTWAIRAMMTWTW